MWCFCRACRPGIVLFLTLSSALGQTADPATSDKSSRPQELTSAPSLDEVFLFQPAGANVGNWQPKDLEFQEVTIPSTEDVTLYGWYCPVTRPVAVIMYLHGNAGNITHRASLLRHLQQRLNVSVLIFDYRGYGKSTALPDAYPTAKGAIADAEAARARLSQLASVAQNQIVIMGRSLGGAIGVQLAAKSPCRGLIIESSFSSLRATAQFHTPKLAFLVPNDKLNSVKAVKRHAGPLLLSHGDRDRVIPYDFGVELFEAANQPKTFVRISGGRHNDRQPEHYYRTMARFLRDLPVTTAR